MLLTVGINIEEVLTTFEAILTKETALDELDQSSIICGQSKEDYAMTMRFTKLQCINSLRLIYQRFGSLVLPFVICTLPQAAQ